jgi:hypothetical protein
MPPGWSREAGVWPAPVSVASVYAETPIAPAPHPRRTKSGTGRGTGRDRWISRAFCGYAASLGNGRRGSPRLVDWSL